MLKDFIYTANVVNGKLIPKPTKLEQYLVRINAWAKFTKSPIFNANALTEEQAKQLFFKIEGDLSPENLCGDGELSKSVVKAKLSLLNGAKKELIKKGFKPPKSYCN